MEVAKVLHMNGGSGDDSYANNSLLQQKVISSTRSVREEAIAKSYSCKLPATFVAADLGCSSGPNTLLVASHLIKCVKRIAKKMNRKSPEYQVFLNDLPGNDFNTIFMSLASFQQDLRDQLLSGFGACYFNGVPGSFYGRLFPPSTLHFAHSSYCLMWLSQVPNGIENNKGNICVWSTSPQNVVEAYYEQFQKDFSLFLKCRAVELVEGGCMVLTLQGRKSDDPLTKDCFYIWRLLARALNDMVSEGILQEEKVDSFNIPIYTPSANEVKMEILKEGSFALDRLHVSEVNWNANHDDSDQSNYNDDDDDDDGSGSFSVAKYMRAVAEPLLVSHFGNQSDTMDRVFERYREIIADCMSKEKTEYTNITVSLTKTKKFD